MYPFRSRTSSQQQLNARVPFQPEPLSTSKSLSFIPNEYKRYPKPNLNDPFASMRTLRDRAADPKQTSPFPSVVRTSLSNEGTTGFHWDLSEYTARRNSLKRFQSTPLIKTVSVPTQRPSSFRVPVPSSHMYRPLKTSRSKPAAGQRNSRNMSSPSLAIPRPWMQNTNTGIHSAVESCPSLILCQIPSRETSSDEGEVNRIHAYIANTQSLKSPSRTQVYSMRWKDRGTHIGQRLVTRISGNRVPSRTMLSISSPMPANADLSPMINANPSYPSVYLASFIESEATSELYEHWPDVFTPLTMEPFSEFIDTDLLSYWSLSSPPPPISLPQEEDPAQSLDISTPRSFIESIPAEIPVCPPEYADAHRPFSVGTPPTRTQLAEAASIPLLSETGEVVNFGNLWLEQKTVVIFIRHFLYVFFSLHFSHCS